MRIVLPVLGRSDPVQYKRQAGYDKDAGVAKKLYHEIGFADMEDYMKLGDKEYADQRN